MEWLLFFAIIIIVVPIQFMLFICLLWFGKKFDRYESIAVEILKIHISNNQIDDTQYYKKQYYNLRNELISHKRNNYNDIPLHADRDEILRAYKKIREDVVNVRKKQLFEGSIRTIADILREKYRDEVIIQQIELFGQKLGYNGNFGSYLDDSPLLSSAIDIISGAYSVICRKK